MEKTMGVCTMKYLITGITGFAGPHLANLLVQEGHDVFGLIRCSNGRETDILDIVSQESFNKIKFIYCDLRDEKRIGDVFKNNKFDWVAHLAAQSHPPTSFVDPMGTFQDNIIGSSNIINSVTRYQPNCKIFFCSTSEVYGNVGMDGRKIKENDLISPANPYGVSKASVDLYMQERMKNGFVSGFITRSFSHTGPRRGKNFSISSDAYRLALIKHGANDSKILDVGNLETTRVVLDVRDVVNAYYKLTITDKSNGRAFNICGDEPRKMSVFTDKLIEISGLQGIEKKISPDLFRKHDIFYQHGDTSALKEITGWSPVISINETLKDLFEYWERKITNG